MKLKHLIFILIFSSLIISCKSVKLDKLEKTTLSYSDLPLEIKKHIFNENFYDCSQPKKYKVISKQDFIFGWIYYTEIHRISDRKFIKMKEFKQEWGNHIIILNDYLYFPNHYNINESDCLKYNFTRIKFE